MEDGLQISFRQEFGLLDANRSQLWIISLGVNDIPHEFPNGSAV